MAGYLGPPVKNCNVQRRLAQEVRDVHTGSLVNPVLSLRPLFHKKFNDYAMTLSCGDVKGAVAMMISQVWVPPRFSQDQHHWQMALPASHVECSGPGHVALVHRHALLEFVPHEAGNTPPRQIVQGVIHPRGRDQERDRGD